MVKSTHILLSNDTARNVAVNALLVFERERVYIQDTLDMIFRDEALEGQDRRLAQELAYGVCRHLITLDYIIHKYCRRPLRKIDPVVLNILRIGLYQLCFLSGTPDYAAINEAVKQVKRVGLRKADAFVNALLRAVQRDLAGTVARQDKHQVDGSRKVLPLSADKNLEFKNDILPDPNKNLVKYLSVAYSHPPWLIDRWIKQYEVEMTIRLCVAGNTRPVLTLRVNRLRCGPAELRDQLRSSGYEVQQYGPAIQVLPPAAPQELPGYQEGFFVVQDVCAMSVAPLLAVKSGERVLDLCAAPGGKTSHLAELMDGQGQIVACDINKDKLGLVKDTCRRLGLEMVQTCLVDKLDDMLEQAGAFDAVLVDAPCSNTGVLARRVEARYLLKPAILGKMAARQLELLRKAAEAVKPDGRILYSTCSIDPKENEAVVQKFLEEHSSFKLVTEKMTLPCIGGEKLESGEYDGEMIKYHDGGFVALMGANDYV
ncbi:MAG: 16S rRNA (cytosine(967)-C(5))-methyltransferase RsmB [Sedimentisphaerales bacterium]|nr:16S rRNA (cytosine(967)-C(5))-methyltransferase RsmB [Sedimentisphaerales bacterium]